MTRSIVFALVLASSSTFLLGCPDDKAAPDTTKASAAPSAAPATPAASAKPAAKGGW
jgi:hypothetical protein